MEDLAIHGVTTTCGVNQELVVDAVREGILGATMLC